MKKYYLVTFQNTHEAMKAERESLLKQVKVVVVPTPTQITKSCGISLKVDEENIKNIIKLVKSENIKVKEIFALDGENVKIMTI